MPVQEVSDFMYLHGVKSISPTDAWAVGHSATYRAHFRTLAEHWDGAGWTVVPTPSPGTGGLSDVDADASSDVWAVGDYFDVQGVRRTLAERWDGVQWTHVPSKNPSSTENQFKSVTVISPSDVWAVGHSDNASSAPQQTLAEHWNGSGFRRFSTPNPGLSQGQSNQLNGVDAVSSTDVWAVGTTDSFYRPRSLVEHWDGVRWARVPSPSPGATQGTFLFDVSAASANDVWAVGYYAVDSTTRKSLILHWDGSSWRHVGSPDPAGGADNFLLSVSADSATDAWAVGEYFDTTTTSTKTLRMHWDGTRWRQL